jgi:hypothetical protein
LYCQVTNFHVQSWARPIFHKPADPRELRLEAHQGEGSSPVKSVPEGHRCFKH